MAKYIPRNSPEAFEICLRICNEERKKRGLPPKTSGKPREKKKVYKPADQWKPRTKVTEELIDRVFKLTNEGRTIQWIAEELDISRVTVQRIKKKWR